MPGVYLSTCFRRFIDVPRAYWERPLALSPKEVILALVPRKYDSYLYQGTRETRAATPAPSTPLPITIEHYRPGEYTGTPEIDKLLVGSRRVYVARVKGVIAHRCALTFALRRTQQHGSPLGPFVPWDLPSPSTGRKACKLW
jgi:hypothetical protein